MENGIGFLSADETMRLRELTGFDFKMQYSLIAIENKIIDLWLGNFISRENAKEALKIIRNAAQNA